MGARYAALHGFLLGLAGLLAGVCSIVGLVSMLGSDYATSGHAGGKFPGGYGQAQFMGMMVWVVLSPVVVLCCVLSSRKLHIAPLPRWLRVLVFVVEAALFIGLAIVAGQKFGFVSAGNAFPTGLQALSGMAIGLACAFLALVNLLLAYRSLSPRNAAPLGYTSLARPAPLGYTAGVATGAVAATGAEVEAHLLSASSSTDGAAHQWMRGHMRGHGASARGVGTVCGFVGAFLFFTALALMCCGLPNTWETFTSDGFKGYASKPIGNSSAMCLEGVPGMPWVHVNMCPEILDRAIMTTFEVTIDDGAADGHTKIALKVFPDIWIFYGALLVMLAAGCLVQEVDALHYAMHRPIKCLRGSTPAQAGSALILSVAVVFWLVYWVHDHNYNEAWPAGQKTKMEVASRTAGQLGLFFLGMLLFPVSRSSMWTKLCGIAWDHALKVHIVFGYMFLICMAAHMFLWWGVYHAQQCFPHDIIAVPMYFPANTGNFSQSIIDGPHADNWTVPLVSVLIWPTFLFMGVFSIERVRRKHFEWFYYSHHFAVVVLSMSVWHAASAWYFLSPGIFIWIVDRVLRFVSGTELVKVVGLRSSNDTGVTRLEIVKPSSGSTGTSGCPLAAWFGRDTESTAGTEKSSWGGLQHSAGQYAFINIPEISSLQWHPFSIASSPLDGSSTFLIKNMSKNSGQFTDKLHKLAQDRQHNNEQSAAEPLTVHVDGPYGNTIFETSRYDAVILVAGGIGITPLHGVLRFLHQLAVANFGPARRVHLVWCVREPALLRTIEDTLLSVADQSLGGRFGFSLFVTKSRRVLTEHGDGVATTDAPGSLPEWMGCQHGRPDLGKEINDVVERTRAQQNERQVSHELRRKIGGPEDDATAPGRGGDEEYTELEQGTGDAKDQGVPRILVWACGPSRMVEDAGNVACEAGLHFLAESFEL